MEKLAFHIRSAVGRDLDELIKLYSDEPSIAHSSGTLRETILFHLLLTDSTAPTYVNIAHIDDKILALSIIRFRSTLNNYEIECITKENFRNQGIGFALINHSINQCRKSGYSTFIANILPDNFSCIRLFEKLGFMIDTATSKNKFITYRLRMKEP
ncbi:GNAT family N-acetyltransferase [Pseudomonas sp. WPR_5_2]|uniref:GNAT family N-acetyltransferase n=1 Tax=Pseudomonas sp. WPR_5_2 TaxID=1907371 RepID=UPI000EAEB773